MSEGQAQRVNSIDTLAAAHELLDYNYKTHKHTVYSWINGVDRTFKQNKLFFLLYSKIGERLYGGDADLARAECKLTIGVPIMREVPEFAEVYDKIIRPHDYETKLDMIKYIQVSSLMTRPQGIKYINQIFDVYANKGVGWGDMIDDQVKRLK